MDNINKLKALGIDAVILNNTLFVVDNDGDLLLAEAVLNFLINSVKYKGESK